MDTITQYQTAPGPSIPVRGQFLAKRKHWLPHERDFGQPISSAAPNLSSLRPSHRRWDSPAPTALLRFGGRCGACRSARPPDQQKKAS